VSWIETNLGECCELYQPQTITTKDLIEDGKYLVYGANGVIGRYDKYNHEEPQLLVTCRGATCGAVNISSPYSWINGNAMVVKPKHKSIDVRFIEYFFRGAVDLGRAITGAAQPQITRQSLSTIKFQYPSILTQQKIVEKLDAIFAEIDTVIATTETNAKNSEVLFQSYVTKVFENKKYDFKLVKFGTTASFVRGPFGGSLKKSIFVEKGYAVYEQQHAIYNQFSEIRYYIDKNKFQEMQRFELKSGDLIMSCSGTMGKVAIVPENIEQGVINQALLKITPNKNVMGEYISRLLSSKFFQDILAKLSGGAAIQNVPAVSVLKDIEVPVPDIKNQKLIVDIIDILEANKNIIKNSYLQKCLEIKALKQSILQQAFSGELVKDEK
jgi:type I restriction enzyme S subunit